MFSKVSAANVHIKDQIVETGPEEENKASRVAKAALAEPSRVGINSTSKRVTRRLRIEGQNPQEVQISAQKVGQLQRKEKTYEGRRDRRGLEHGVGEKVYENGDFSKGSWEHGKFIKGSVKWTDVDSEGEEGVYEGEVKGNKFSGKGIFSYKDGEFEEGESKKGALSEGLVKLTTPEGDLYEGQVKYGGYHGQGIFTFKDGDVAKGRWENGSFVEGELKKGEEVYKGKFVKWKLNGPGKVVLENGDYYEGIFVNDRCIQGTVKITYDHQIYVGQFNKGKANGQGICSQRDSDDYVEGEFKDGVFKIGKGRNTGQNGDVYEGEMKGKMRHGKGIITKSNGEKIEVQYHNNKLVHSKNIALS